MGKTGQRVAGLLLAAGASLRMGQPKQLLSIGRGTLLETALKEALNSDLDKVVLVLGHKAGEIRRALGKTLQAPKLKTLENRHYKRGISSSIIAGLSSIEAESDHVMILLADMPQIKSAHINLLLHHYLESGLSLGAIQAKGRRSHPVIFSRRLYHELHGLRGDEGARAIFKKYMGQVCLVKSDQSYNDFDIDTPEDFASYQKSQQKE